MPVDITFSAADVPFSFRNANQAWSSRRVAHLIVCDGERVGRGECSPLPGYSNDTLEACRDALLSIEPNMLSELKEHACAVLPGESPLSIAELLAPLSLPPAAEFALWSALIELGGRTRLVKNAAPIPVATLVDLNQLHTLDRRELLLSLSKTQTVKVKVSPHITDVQVEFLRELAHHSTLRIDMNGAFDLERDGALLASLFSVPIEFAEEPVPPSQLRALFERFDAPIALDESLQAEDALSLVHKHQHQLAALVVKPTALGMGRALKLKGLTSETRSAPSTTPAPRLIVSHTFEGVLGYVALALFAFHTLGPSCIAQGLARHSVVEGDPLASTPLGGRVQTAKSIIPWKEHAWPLVLKHS